jgi:hypothetical protein
MGPRVVLSSHSSCLPATLNYRTKDKDDRVPLNIAKQKMKLSRLSKLE